MYIDDIIFCSSTDTSHDYGTKVYNIFIYEFLNQE